MAERTGLEPATPGVTGRYSNQLNYRSDLEGSGIVQGTPRGCHALDRREAVPAAIDHLPPSGFQGGTVTPRL